MIYAILVNPRFTYLLTYVLMEVALSAALSSYSKHFSPAQHFKCLCSIQK